MTEGVDNFALVTVRFLGPSQISSDVFTQLSVFTMDGTATGQENVLINEPL